jgi:hypothetical protein
MNTTTAGAVKSGPQGRPEGTAAKRRPLTAPVTPHAHNQNRPAHRGGTSIHNHHEVRFK